MNLYFYHIKKQLFLPGFLFLAGILCFACTEDITDCSRRNGPFAEEILELPPISSLEAWDGLNIILHQANEQQVIVKGGKNVLSNIQLEVKEGMLIVRDENRCDWSRSYEERQVHLYLPKVDSIFQNGYGLISSADTLNLDKLQIEARIGSGEIDLLVSANKVNVISSRYGTIALGGKVNKLLVQYLSNNAIFDGRNLIAENIEIFHKSNNAFHLQPHNTLSGKLLWRGNVYLYHPPAQMELTISGEGRVIPQYQE
jgi:hypothetical protein